MANYGAKVIKNAGGGLKNLNINSENVLLKVKKRGAFKLRIVSGSGSLTISYEDLGYRPIALVYVQKRTDDDSGFATSGGYYSGDWRYDGVTFSGIQETKIYNNKIVLSYTDTQSSKTFDLLGYYYIFEESIE